MMTDDEILTVVQAHKEGKKIECKGRHLSHPMIPKWNEWTDSNPHWNFAEFDYRVAPEPRKPREWNITICNGQIVGQSVFTGSCEIEKILIREVIE